MARNEERNEKAENNEGIQITPPGKDEEMCILCEKNPAYKTATVDSDLCEDCRQGFMYTPIRYSGIIAIILVIVTAVSGLLVFRAQKPAVKTISDSFKILQAGDIQAASSGLSQPESRALIGWKSASVFAELFYKRNTAQNLSTLVDELFYDKEADPTLKWQDIAGKGNINAPWNKELKAKYDYLNNIEKIAEEKSKHFTYYYDKFQYGEIEIKDIPYQEIISKYEAELAKATTNEEKGVICYYMLATSSICEQDVKTQLGYCKSIQQHLPECYWLYLENLITLSIQTGEYEAAKKHIATLSSLSVTDANFAKRYTAMMYRYQGKYSESLTILKELIANIETSGVYEAFYEAALCEFLSGNLDAAYEYTIKCVRDEYCMTYEAINLYAMLSKKLGTDEGYEYASKIFAQYGMKISPTVDKYLNGEITIEEMLAEGEVVFE